MAAIAWMDSQLGRVLDELESLGLDSNTLVILHADHGWSLGEHGAWQKFTNWEHGVRVPLIIRAPWLPGSAGKRSTEPVELVDVFPTSVDLLELKMPPGESFDGQSLAPILSEEEDADFRGFALSQYMRCPQQLQNASLFWKDNACLFTDRTQIPFMGYTLRTPQWRYTEWLKWNGTSLAADWDESVGVELYSHAGDDGSDFDAFENVNQAKDHPDVATQLRNKLMKIVASQTRSIRV